jgi:hypothetical protein
MPAPAPRLSPRAPRPNGLSSVPAAPRAEPKPISHAAIAARAYERFQARGAVDGHDQADWEAAERELTAGVRSAVPSAELGGES